MKKDPSTISVLLVDDDTLVRESVRTHLSRQADIEVVGEAENGIQALQLSEELEPDVIILDMSMPEMGGIEVLRAMAGRRKTPEIIVYSFLESLEPKVLEAGAAAFISKRFAARTIVSTIRSVMGAGSLDRE